MSYLDPKERVIDLQLTSYGRYLISIGKLKPVYYGFFDDDIIYDAEYAGVTTEEQSSIEPRIQENTPRFASQSIFSARELAIFDGSPNVINDLIIGSDLEDEEKLAQGLIKLQEGPEGAEVLQQPLGRTNSFYEYAPAWNVAFLKAPLSSSVDYQVISGSGGNITKNIPQLNVDLRYEIIRNGPNALDAEGIDLETEQGSEILPESIVNFQNGATIELKQDALILRIEESNTFFEKENFEIECFWIQTVKGKEHLIPLNFYSDLATVNAVGADCKIEAVEQYFRFEGDEEIPPDDICYLIKKDKISQVYNDIDSKPIRQFTPKCIYKEYYFK